MPSVFDSNQQFENVQKMYSPSQSAPTILVHQVGLKFFYELKRRSKIWVEKSRVQKNRVIVIKKTKKQPGLFSL